MPSWKDNMIDASVDELESAKNTAVALIGGNIGNSTLNLFYTDSLEEAEKGIRNLNEFSNKSWILSAMLLYTIIYNKQLYEQSGMRWDEYSANAKKRLGMHKRDISEQLSAARFFIKYHSMLEKAGYDLSGSNRKLARAELAIKLSGDVKKVIKHIVSDTWYEFKEWYSSFNQNVKLQAPTEYKRDDIEIKKSKVYINGLEAVSVSDSIPEQDRQRIEEYIRKIFEAMKQGYEPAIVPVYDKKEASILPRLRDKYRQGK